MKLGLYFDLRNPEAWRRPWADHYAQTLEWMQGAENLGAESIWVTEHHFFEDGYLPQPLTLAAAIAARTRRVRIGTAVLLAPLYPAVSIAEDAALVDLISGGRLELGLGAGYVRPEFEAYGADRSKRFATCDARILEVRDLLEEGGVTPPPVQNPFPLWAGYLGPRGARRAGRLGTGLLNLNPDFLEPYRQGLAEGGHDPRSARMGGVLSLLCADDPEEAFERVLPHLQHQLNTYRQGNYAGSGREARLLSLDELRSARRASGPIQPLEVLTAEDAARRIRELTAGLPAEHVYLWASVAGMPDDLVERHIELTSTTLREALAEADPD
ncbi:MAG: LLM class flavin-dependent oxidoreductase [Proteobacteria bacterium]|nr:LLM class flavin-dependent oxidoreductase [Pseudomonadota bacterium]